MLRLILCLEFLGLASWTLVDCSIDVNLGCCLYFRWVGYSRIGFFLRYVAWVCLHGWFLTLLQLSVGMFVSDELF